MIFTILFFVMLFVSGYAIGHTGVREVRHRKTYGLPYKEVRNMSWPAAEIVAAYRAIPINHRPSEDIVRIVRALDTKYGVDHVDNHMRKKVRGAGYGYDLVPGWCVDLPCPYAEYRDLAAHSQQIKKALADQEKALAVAAVRGELDQANQLIERLRQEHQWIKEATEEVTKELT